MAIKLQYREFIIVCDGVEDAIALMKMLRDGAPIVSGPLSPHAHNSYETRNKCSVCMPPSRIRMRRRIRRLARRGIAPEEIARRTGQTIGEVNDAMSTMRSIVGAVAPSKEGK